MAQDLKEFQIASSVRERLEDKQWIKQQLVAGKTGQEILEFSDPTMDKFYTAACRLFDQKQYVEAGDSFLFLVTLNPYHYDYWLGLGAATQWLGDYEAAIDAYEMAAICQLENPIPYFHLAKCLFAMHDRESALQAIELALEYSEDRTTFEELHRQAVAAKAMLLKEE
ncbi:MAG: SycD/LcrH family type III secretion system chaperone [Parachlamydiaceae bacterium]|nr:SycD/LcrH family type III secretion system chaperone [Parachlamydiaceae bacterium]